MTTRPGVPLKRVVLDACDGPFGSSLKSDHYRDDGARVIRLGNVGVGSWVESDAAFIDLDYWRLLNRHHAAPGDLIVAGLGDENHPVGRACVLPEVGPAMVKADCYRLRLDPMLADPRFVALFLSSAAGSREASKLADGATRSRLTLSKALSIPIPDIDLERQRETVDYLDAKTARTDEAVRVLRGLGGRLLERHAAFRELLLHRGTRSTRSLSSLLTERITDGPHETPEFVDEGIPFLSVDNMLGQDVSFEGCRLISAKAHAVYAHKSCPRRGDLLVTKAAAVGRVALVATDRVFNVWSPIAILRPNRGLVLPEYLRLILLGADAQSRMKLASTMSTQENLSMRDLSSLRVDVPNLATQRSVVAEEESASEMARSLVGLIRRQTGLLLERRQALITAAVTGQIEIPRMAS